MLELIVKNGQIQIKPSEHNSLLLLRNTIDKGDVVELGEATYMLNNLIIEHMTVVRSLDIHWNNTMYSHAKVPKFDMETLPFVIFQSGNFYLANIKTCTYQLLVKAKSFRPGFCL